MKQMVAVLITILFPFFYAIAQENDDTERVSINILPPDCEDVTQEGAQHLFTKMQQLVTNNGMADYGYNERFVLTAKVNILSKDIVPSAPTRISQKVEVIFLIGDVVDNKLFETSSLIVSGIGTNETKAVVSAFQQINVKNEQFKDFLKSAKQKIVNYYTNNCDALIFQARTLAEMQEYDKAIHILITVPNVCNDCYKRSQEALIPIYTKKINEEGVTLLNKAKAEWARNPTAEGASDAFALTSAINSQSSCYSQVCAFHDTVGNQLRDNEKRKWDFQVKQYEDNQKFKQSIVEACRAIGVAWGKNQPKRISTTIIKGWW